MNLEEILMRVRRCGADLSVIDGKLKATPPGILPPELKAAIRERAAEIKARLCADSDASVGKATDPNAPMPTFPIDIEAVVDAIASEPRSPFLNDLALSHAARASVEACRIVRDLPEPARHEALLLCAHATTETVTAIRSGNYKLGYDLLESLPGRIKALRPQ